jgi:hypothetical protein
LAKYTQQKSCHLNYFILFFGDPGPCAYQAGTVSLEPFSFSCLFEAEWLELKAYTLSHSTGPFFVMGFFEIGSCKLVAQADFEL